MTTALQSAGKTHSEWYLEVRPQYIADVRTFGSFDLMDLRQPAGSFPDPSKDTWDLQVITGPRGPARIDLGAGAFHCEISPGTIVVSAANENTDYELGNDHELIILSMPASRTRAILEQSEIKIEENFGDLHSMIWRDNSIRDLALNIWRAAKQDKHAPDVDPDASLLELVLKLAKRADKGFATKETVWRLSPHARNRVTDYIEAHIEDALPLFKLAEIADLSPFHFARSFRADMGDTPNQYVMRRRLRHAEDLIVHSNDSLTSIAAACGFSSQPRMNEAFSKHYGMTPGALRRTARS